MKKIFLSLFFLAYFCIPFPSRVFAASETVSCNSTTLNQATLDGYIGDDVTFTDGGDGICIFTGTLSAASVTVNTGVTLTHNATGFDKDPGEGVLMAGLEITTTGDFTIQSGAYVNVNYKGCQGSNSDGYGPNAVTGVCTIRTTGYGKTDKGGAAYGGTGGAGSGGASSTYGDQTAPILFGSGGDSDSGTAPSGGGKVQLNVGGVLTVNGSISANGEANTYYFAGGGSGGSVYITTGTLTGSGTISANGGNGYGNGGGGGGGRAAVYYGSNSFSLTSLTVAGGTGVGYSAGANGTTYIVDQTNNDLYVTSGLGLANGATYSFRDIIVSSGALITDDVGATTATIAATRNISFTSSTITIDSLTALNMSAGGAITFAGTTMTGWTPTNGNSGLTFNITSANSVTLSSSSSIQASSVWTATTVTLDSGTSINTNFLGCPGGLSNGFGPNASTGFCAVTTTGYGKNDKGGAAYGGIGGGGSGGASAIYGDQTAPTLIGSGGDTDCGAVPYAVGGGKVQITTSGTTTVNGSISANGKTYTGCHSGGGSGGSVYITTATLTGSGTVSANGGNGYGNGGGGGGGRVAIYYGTTDFNFSNVTATGGTLAGSGVNGANGTTYIVDQTNNDLYVTSGLGLANGATYSFRDIIVSSGALITDDVGATTATIAATRNISFTSSTITIDSLTALNMSAGGAITFAGTTMTGWTPTNGNSGLTFNITSANSVTLSSSSSIQASSVWTATTVTLDSGTSINTNFLGCPGGLSNGFGPNASTGFCAVTTTGYGKNDKGGAAYGGIGGGGSGGASAIYGDQTAPTLIGSGGDTDCGVVPYAVGGGRVQITTSGTTTVNGSISANGKTYTGCNGGGGSGGSVYITSGTLTGTGSISTTGGNGYGDGGGAGGGRVAIYYGTTDFNFSNATATGGTKVGSGVNGANGTVYTIQTVSLSSIAITDNSGYTNDSTPAIAITKSGATPTHIAFSCNAGSNWSDWIAYPDDDVVNDDDGPVFDITNGATGCSATNELKTISAKIKNDTSTSSTVSDTTTYDTVAPTVSNVTATNANGTYGVDTVILATVQFDNSMVVTGMPQLQLDFNGTDRQANYSTVSTDTLSFTYTIVNGDNKTDLDYTGTGALTFNSGTIKDLAGNTATLTLPTPGAASSLGANKDINISTNQTPTAASATGTKLTNGSGNVTVSFIADDPDDDDTLQALVEYNVGAGWQKATLSEIGGNITATYGTVNVENDNAYQVGNASGYITSSSGANTISVIWNSKTDVPTASTASVQIRVTPYDGIEAGSAVSSSTFIVDNVSPTSLSTFAVPGSTLNSISLSWISATDTYFNHYEIWYGTNSLDVDNRTGTALEWDNSDDGALTTATTTGTTITAGISEDLTYYLKIWAIDNYGNEITLAAISRSTNTTPRSLANFIASATTSSTITWTWTSAVDANFNHYEIWYGTNSDDVIGRTGTAVEWDADNDATLTTATTATTTITGLSEDTTYYAKIFAIDNNSNEATLSVSTGNNNGKPTLSGVSLVQLTDGTGDVTVSFTANDLDWNNVSALVEYNVGSGWQKATLSEEGSDVTATYGTPAVENDNTYQVGNAGGYIVTGSGANTVTVVWLSGTDVSTTNTATAQVRITPYDTIEPGAMVASDNSTIDNVDPVGLATFERTGTTFSTLVLSWTAITSEFGFNHYEIWYGTNADDVIGRTGTAFEWDQTDDANLSTMATVGTTLTGLSESTTYYVKIFALDNMGNEMTLDSLTTFTNTRPVVSSASAMETTDGSGEVTLTIIGSDANSEDLEYLVEYNTGAGWEKATLSEMTEDTIVEYGVSPMVENDNARQVGTDGSPIPGNAGPNTLTVIWLAGTDEPDVEIANVQFRVTPYDGNENGGATTSEAFALDTYDPQNLTMFVVGSFTGTTVTWTWSAVTDTNFNHYEIWYSSTQSDAENRSGTAMEWDSVDDVTLASAETATTTITGLVANDTYYFKLFSLDDFGNESASVTRSNTMNSAPSVSTTTATFPTTGTGEVTISTTLSDAEANNVQLLVEYNIGSGWEKATLSTEAGDLTNTRGTVPTLANTDPRQLSGISTTGGSNVLTFVWLSKIDEPSADTSTAQIRVTPYDGSMEGSAMASSEFIIDNAAPSGLWGLMLDGTGDRIDVTWVSVLDSHFSMYEIQYSSNGGAYTVFNAVQDATLATAETSSVWISTLTTSSGNSYNVNLYALDTYGNRSGPLSGTLNIGGSGTTTGPGGGSNGGGGHSSSHTETIETVVDIIPEIEVPQEEETIPPEDTAPENVEITGSNPSTSLNEIVDNLGTIIPEDLTWAESTLKNFGEMDLIQTIYSSSDPLQLLIFNFFFQPFGGLSRMEVLQLSMLTFMGEDLGQELQISMVSGISIFSDAEQNLTDIPYLNIAFEHGVISGYPDKTFRPTQEATRAEALKMLLLSSGVRIVIDSSQGLLAQFNLEKNPFSDMSLNDWYAPYVLYAYKKGIINGYGDGTFKGNQMISRAEFSKILTNLYEQAVNTHATAKVRVPRIVIPMLN